MDSKKLKRELTSIPRELHGLYRAIREMNTLVCESCFKEELREHPVLGSKWTSDWYLEMAELAYEIGWRTITPRPNRKRWFFQEFEVCGPECFRKNEFEISEWNQES